MADRTHWRSEAEAKITVRGNREYILKRLNPEDEWINPWNPHILRLWQANMDIQVLTNPVAAAAYLLSYVGKDEKGELHAVREALQQAPPNATTSHLMIRITQAILSSRQVSKQEAMFSEPLYFSSRSSIFVPAFPPSKQNRITLPHSVVRRIQDTDSTDI